MSVAMTRNAAIWRSLLFCAPLALSACGGSGSGGERPDFPTANQAATDLIIAYVDANGDPAVGLSRSPAFIRGGTTEYTGAFQGAVDGNGVVGDLAVTVAFGTGDVTASADNIQNAATGYYSGVLRGTGDVDGDPDSNLPQLTLVLEGNLDDGTTSQAAALLLDGNFFAANADAQGAMAGSVDGTIGGVLFEDGVFAAEN